MKNSFSDDSNQSLIRNRSKIKNNNKNFNDNNTNDENIFYENEIQLEQSRQIIAESDRRNLILRRNRFPTKAIALASFLFLLGSISLTISILLLRREKVPDNAYPLLIIGILTFLPGFYYVRIAIWSYFKYDGFNFRQIPEFED